MKKTIILLLLVTNLVSNAQNMLEWSKKKLSFSDFPQPVITLDSMSYGVYLTPKIGFYYNMAVIELLFRKNFNQNVTAEFYLNKSYLYAPNLKVAESFLSYAQTIYDLTELHARQYRKKIFEQKNASSNNDLYDNLLEETIRNLRKEIAEINEKTNSGLHQEELNKIYNKILTDLDSLYNFCKECNPRKVKKQ